MKTPGNSPISPKPTQDITAEEMDTSSATALALYGVAWRPGNAVPSRRASAAAGKGASANRKKNDGTTSGKITDALQPRAQAGMSSNCEHHVDHTKTKMQRQQQQQPQVPAIEASDPRVPQTPASTASQNAKPQHPGFSQSHTDYLSTLLVNRRQQEGHHLADQPWPSSRGDGDLSSSSRPRSKNHGRRRDRQRHGSSVGGYNIFSSAMTGAEMEEQGRYSTADALALAPETERDSSHWPSSYHQSQAFLPPSAHHLPTLNFPVYPSLPINALGDAKRRRESHQITVARPASGETNSNRLEFADMMHGAARALEIENNSALVDNGGRHSSMDDGENSGSTYMTPRMRRTKQHEYDETDEDGEDDVFHLLDEVPHPTATANATATTTSVTTSTIQGGDAVGSSNAIVVKDPNPQVEAKCQPPKESPPPSADKVACVEKQREAAIKPLTLYCTGATDLSPPHLCSSIAAATSRVPPSTTVSSVDPLSHTHQQQQKCTDGAPAPPVATTSTENPPIDDGGSSRHSSSNLPTEKKKGNPSPPSPFTGQESPITGVSLPTLGPSITEPRQVKYPSSSEETDRYLRSLSTNDLIILSTKAQCELQERGRNFSSILTSGGGGGHRGSASTAAPRAGAGNNGTLTATAIREEVRSGSHSDGGVDLDLGIGIDIGIGSGRLNKEKRKHDDTDPDPDPEKQHAGANTKMMTTTASETKQGEQKKCKKQKNEDATAAPSIGNDPVATTATATAEIAIAKRCLDAAFDQLKRRAQLDDEVAKAKGANDSDGLWLRSSRKQLEAASKTDPESSAITTATGTATTTAGVHADPTKEYPIKKALREKTMSMVRHSVKERCRESSDVCCGDPFVIIDRKDCSG